MSGLISMNRRIRPIRLSLWHPPARTGPIPPGRRSSRHAPAVLALAAALLVSAAPAHAADHRTRVVVVERTPATQAAERAVRRHGGTVGRSLPLAGGFAARVPARSLPALRRVAAVAGIRSDARVTMRSGPDCMPGDATCFDSLPPEAAWPRAIGLDAVPNKYQGDGVTVASIDTGVTPTPNLAGRALASVDLTSERDGIDRFGHGTHMAGVIAGDGTTSFGAYEGAAPETRLVSVKVAGWDGATDVSTVIAALQWVVANRARFNIRIVNLSWGTDAGQSYGVDPLDLAVERAWAAGLVVVVSAGNGGPPTPAAGTVTKPAEDPFVITVGAVDDKGTQGINDDVLPNFTGRGPTATDNLSKPDIVAPGAHLVSLSAPGAAITNEYPSTMTAPYRRGSGTSMANAVVSGLVAQLISLQPSLTPDRVKYMLMSSARSAASTDPLAVGAGEVDGWGARTAAAGLANQGVAPSLGTGSLAASRGTVGVVLDDSNQTVLDASSGNITQALTDIDTSGGSWFGDNWFGGSWFGGSWFGGSWFGGSWFGGSWFGGSWFGQPTSTEDYGGSWFGGAWYGAWDQ